MIEQSKTVEQFDCSICCNSYKLLIRGHLQKIVCLNCDLEFCRNCQFKFERDRCMNCGIQFTREFVLDNLGEKFLKEVVRPRITSELMVNQTKLLPATQLEVQRLQHVKKYKRNLRFGLTTPNFSMPNSVSHEIFGCPKEGCRGFVQSGYKCELCLSQVCCSCRIIIKENDLEHQCLEEDLSSVKLLAKDTRPCPKCAVKIFKIEGCDHMFCTHCRTHFSWKNGKVLKESTNGHYLTLSRYAENVATIDRVEREGFSCEEYGFSLSDHNETRPYGCPANLERSLFDDSSEIRTMFRIKYLKETILTKNEENLKNLRVKYLIEEIDYKTWSDRVYTEFKKTEQAHLCSHILSIYLSTVDYLKKDLNKSKDFIRITDSLERLIELCNDSFLSVKREYGGSSFHLRKINESLQSPAFTLI